MYTVLYGHLETINVKVGDMLVFGDKIGKAGNTGQSTGTHIHLGVIHGTKPLWRLASMPVPNVPDKVESEYFITDDIWVEGKSKITTQWLGYKNHYAFDIVNTLKKWDFVWNRNYIGFVTEIGFNDAGYGNYVIISYSKDKKTSDFGDSSQIALLKKQNEELINKVEELNKRINTAIVVLKGE